MNRRLILVILILSVLLSPSSADQNNYAIPSVDIEYLHWTEHGFVFAPFDSIIFVYDVGVGTTQNFSTDSVIYDIEVFNGSIYAGTGMGNIQVFDLEGNLSDLVEIDQLSFVSDISVSPDGKYLAAAVSNLIFEPNYTQIYHLSNLSLYQTIHGHSDTISSVEWSPSSDKIVTVSSDGSLIVADVKSRRELYYTRFDDFVYGSEVQWSPNSQMISVVDTQSHLSVINATTGDFIYNMTLDNIIGHGWHTRRDELFVLNYDHTLDQYNITRYDFSHSYYPQPEYLTTIPEAITAMSLHPREEAPRMALATDSGYIVVLDTDYSFVEITDVSYSVETQYVESNTPQLWLVVTISGFLLLSLWARNRFSSDPDNDTDFSSKQIDQYQDDVHTESMADTEDEIDHTYVSGYGRVRICCYNAARIGDGYCLCGRAIPEKLRNAVVD